ncbi:MAG: hypothetical protein APU95_06040 [Hadesarchaea archaeon YNP_N21]|nr:MAG: hypothetical protein APU95_06040 [Hadesarchaea archaeon YNP_N21]
MSPELKDSKILNLEKQLIAIDRHLMEIERRLDAIEHVIGATRSSEGMRRNFASNKNSPKSNHSYLTRTIEEARRGYSRHCR